MCAKYFNKSENNIEILARELDKFRCNDASGKFTGWSGIAYVEFSTAMESYIDFDKAIPAYERGLIFSRAINDAATKGVLNAKNLLGSICKKENEYLNFPKKDFILVTNISIKYFEDLNRKTRKYKSITFSSRLPKKFDRKSFTAEWSSQNNSKLPTNYTWVNIAVKARTQYEAFNLAMDELDLVRGIWNLYLNKRILIGFKGTNTKPTNEITLGALHTLHFPDGKPATEDELFWYEPDYTEKRVEIEGEWEKLKHFEQQVNKSLSKHLYKLEIEDAIRRYVRALDYRDLHISFLEFWSLLEKLTGITNADYEKMIKRVVFLYANSETVKPIVQHLRIYRNSNVHTGQRSDNINQYLQQLKEYVNEILRFHLRNYYKFSSLEEATEFLDLPTDIIFMEEKIKILKNAIKYRSGGNKKSKGK